jgi:hypothetical protein
MHNGCILCGGVGSGKSLTAIAYYIEHHKGKQLYIITTARKRDTAEWPSELFKFGEEYFNCGLDYVTVDSWNNIDKYKDVTDAFFIFDEQRVVGGGVWAKDFIKIAKANHWILLSATPGDNWMDYIAVFVANGYYKNRTEFLRRHVIFDPYVTFPKVRKYVDVEYLIKCRDHCLVQMPFEKPSERHHRDIHCDYDENAYKIAREARWNEDEDKPIENASELCQVLRRISSSDESRLERVRDILRKRRKAIIFYNYNYELDILRQLSDEYVVAEWNGQKHENIQEGDSWVYLVQYTAGAEGWNCVTTDCVIFYSESYSYKAMEQACGRIDRLNTPYKNLWYFHLRSDSSIDKAVERCLKMKKDFNEKAFLLEG